MKKLKYICIAGAFVGMANASFLALSEDFDSYTTGVTLNGQGGWVTVGAELVTSASFDSSPAVATIGYAASAVNSDISISGISVPMIPSIVNDKMTASFDILYNENTLGGALDFEVAFQTTSSGILGALVFTPGGSGFYNVSFDSSYIAALMPNVGAILNNTPTNFEISTWSIGGVTKLELKSVGVTIIPAMTISPAGADAVEGFYATLFNTDDVTSDTGFKIDNVSVVPEPSSVLLLGLSALGLIRRKR